MMHAYSLPSFLQDDPGRQIITGSFRPIDHGEWSDQAYIKPVTRFFRSIAASDRAAVADYIRKHAESAKWRDQVGRTALHLAVLCSARDICKDLIAAGARMTARLVDGRTALHLACQLGLEDVVVAMLQKSVKNKDEAEAREKAVSLRKEGETKAVKEHDEKVGLRQISPTMAHRALALDARLVG